MEIHVYFEDRKISFLQLKLRAYAYQSEAKTTIFIVSLQLLLKERIGHCQSIVIIASKGKVLLHLMRPSEVSPDNYCLLQLQY